MDYTELMNGLATSVGIEGMELKDGATALEIDGMTVGFIHDQASGDTTDDGIMVVVEIGYPPPDADGPFGSVMLKANYLLGGTGGAVLCQNPDTDAYAVMRRYPLAAHDVASFSKALETLLSTAENWKEVLSGMREAEDAKSERDAEADDAEVPPSDFHAGGFLQV